MEAAHAEAERIRLIGGSEAGAIECVGKAEAEKMRLKASAYKQYGEAAMLALVLDTLPKVRCVSIYIILTYCNIRSTINKKDLYFFVFYRLLLRLPLLWPRLIL